MRSPYTMTIEKSTTFRMPLAMPFERQNGNAFMFAFELVPKSVLILICDFSSIATDDCYASRCRLWMIQCGSSTQKNSAIDVTHRQRFRIYSIENQRPIGYK